MRLDLSSLMFNMNIEKGGGTPSWGTSLGQSYKEEHRFTYKGCEDILVGMLYKKVNDDDVTCPLGKGGNKKDDYEFVLSSVFEKIYVNDVKIPNAKFLLLVVKQLVGEHTEHIGRTTLKYNPKMTYKEEKINEDCFEKIKKELNLSDEAAWFISDLNIVNQDEIHFTAKIVNATQSQTYKTSEARKNYCEKRADKVEKQDIIIKPVKKIEMNDDPLIIKSDKKIEIKI